MAAAAAESFYGACRAAAPGSLADELPKAMGRAVEEQQQAANARRECNSFRCVLICAFT